VGERSRFASEEELAAAVRPGAWNALRIRAVGPRAEVFVNGTRTAELIDEAGSAAALSGVLALQLHSGPPMEVRFRNFRLEDLGGVHDDRERTEARWIWTHRDPQEGEEAWFRHVFELPGEPLGATLWAVADDAFEAYLNGRHVASGEGAQHRQEVDVLGDLRAGRNVLALWAHNVDGTAAALAFVRVRGAGWVRDVFTGPEWQGARTEPPGWLEAGEDGPWGPVHVWGPVGTEPWPRPSTSIKHARLTALPGEEVRVPDGFVCDLVYSVPRARQGSWVALCFDPAGRAYTSDQHGFLYRTTLDATGEVLRVERIDVPLGEAQGLCWRSTRSTSSSTAPGASRAGSTASPTATATTASTAWRSCAASRARASTACTPSCADPARRCTWWGATRSRRRPRPSRRGARRSCPSGGCPSPWRRSRSRSSR
jgi:hypothetical protein